MEKLIQTGINLLVNVGSFRGTYFIHSLSQTVFFTLGGLTSVHSLSVLSFERVSTL